MERVNIDTRGLMTAEIDEKNIASEALFDSIFDDGSYTGVSTEAMGFVTCYPAYAVVYCNCLVVRPVTDNAEFHFEALASAVIGRLTDSHLIQPVRLSENFKTLQYISDDEDPEQRHIITFEVSKKKLYAHFHWNVPRT